MDDSRLNRQFIPENVRVVVFDFDNTLVDCITPKVAQHKHTAKQLGIDLSDEFIRENWSRHSFTSLLATLYGDQATTANQLIIEQYDLFPKEVYDDTQRVLSVLGDSGLRLALLTSVRGDRLEEDLVATGIDRVVFDYIQTEEATPVHKPNGAVFDPTIAWLSSIDATPDEAIYIGDALEDMQAASEAGLGFVGVERGFVSRQQFESVGALCVSSLSELISAR